jgi:hypothetical protein
MRDEIASPLAQAIVCWRTSEEGGRRSGPPTVPVYWTTSVFVETAGLPPIVEETPTLSIGLERIQTRSDGSWLCKVGFLAPELAAPNLVPGREIQVLEGPRMVASALVTETYPN